MILLWLNPSGSNTAEPASDACTIGLILNIDQDKKRKKKNCGCEKLVGISTSRVTFVLQKLAYNCV